MRKEIAGEPPLEIEQREVNFCVFHQSTDQNKPL